MKSENTTRESQRINELVTEYRNKGYTVSVPKGRNETPLFLREAGYLPDLIATSDSESLIIEVKSRQTASDLDRLARIAERVNSQPGWQFVLVFTNPREKLSDEVRPSLQKVHELLEKSRIIGTSTDAHREASFLFAWSAIEASLRLLQSEAKSTRATTSGWSLARDAAMLGYIDRDDAQLLERMFKQRNAILHAGEVVAPTNDSINTLQRIALEIVNQAEGQRPN